MNCRILIFLLFFPCLLANCNEFILLTGKPYFPMPEIWVCERCGFRNYDGIEKCPVCGTSRWEDEE